jgi:chromosome segregation ATPase
MSGIDEMEDFKREVRTDLRELTKNVSDLTKAVSDMTTSLAVSEEQKKHQERVNNTVSSELNSIKGRISKLELYNAENKQSASFLNKYYPVLFCVAVAVVAYVSNIGRSW